MESHSIDSFILETSRQFNLVIISLHDSLASSLARFIFAQGMHLYEIFAKLAEKNDTSFSQSN